MDDKRQKQAVSLYLQLLENVRISDCKTEATCRAFLGSRLIFKLIVDGIHPLVVLLRVLDPARIDLPGSYTNNSSILPLPRQMVGNARPPSELTLLG